MNDLIFQIASDVSLPQFKVVGHRQKTIEASLSTGEFHRWDSNPRPGDHLARGAIHKLSILRSYRALGARGTTTGKPSVAELE